MSWALIGREPPELRVVFLERPESALLEGPAQEIEGLAVDAAGPGLRDSELRRDLVEAAPVEVEPLDQGSLAVGQPFEGAANSGRLGPSDNVGLRRLDGLGFVLAEGGDHEGGGQLSEDLVGTREVCCGVALGWAGRLNLGLGFEHVVGTGGGSDQAVAPGRQIGLAPDVIDDRPAHPVVGEGIEFHPARRVEAISRADQAFHARREQIVQLALNAELSTHLVRDARHEGPPLIDEVSVVSHLGIAHFAALRRGPRPDYTRGPGTVKIHEAVVSTGIPG